MPASSRRSSAAGTSRAVQTRPMAIPRRGTPACASSSPTTPRSDSAIAGTSIRSSQSCCGPAREPFRSRFKSGQPKAPTRLCSCSTAARSSFTKAAKLLPSSPVQDCGGLRLVELPAALVAASPTLFVQNPMAAQIALGSLPDASDLLRILLDGPHPSVAGRLAGGFRAIGRAALADEIVGRHARRRAMP